MCKVLLLIDYQKGFKSACSKATKFKDAKIFTRYDKYSCVEDGLVQLLHGNTMTYIAGWESDACVL